MNRNNYSTTRNLIFETTMFLNNNERVLTHPFNWVFLVTIHIYPQFKKNSSRKKNGLSAMNDVIKSTSKYIFKESFVLKNPFIICMPFCCISVDMNEKGMSRFIVYTFKDQNTVWFLYFFFLHQNISEFSTGFSLIINKYY